MLVPQNADDIRRAASLQAERALAQLAKDRAELARAGDSATIATLDALMHELSALLQLPTSDSPLPITHE